MPGVDADEAPDFEDYAQPTKLSPMTIMTDAFSSACDHWHRRRSCPGPSSPPLSCLAPLASPAAASWQLLVAHKIIASDDAPAELMPNHDDEPPSHSKAATEHLHVTYGQPRPTFLLTLCDG